MVKPDSRIKKGCLARARQPGSRERRELSPEEDIQAARSPSSLSLASTASGTMSAGTSTNEALSANGPTSAPLQMAEAVPADDITQQLLERIRHRMPPRRTSDRTNTSTATASVAEEDRNGVAQSPHRNLSAVLTDPIEKVAHTIEAAILGVGTGSGADGSGDGAAPPWSTAARRLATTGVQRSARRPHA